MALIARFATAIDAGRYGEYRPGAMSEGAAAGERPGTRIGSDTSFAVGRHHLYGGRFCPSTHRLEIIRTLTGLQAAVSVSYVHGLRDARGWAFRPPTGPDPINGFTLLREAYEATDETYSGSVSVPVLWDRVAGRIANTDAVTIGLDLIAGSAPTQDTIYAPSDQDHIEAFDRWAVTAFRRGIPRAAISDQAALDLLAALRQLERLLCAHPFVIGDHLTDADIRLWVLLVRYDCGPNVHGRLGPRLSTFPAVWDWARSLYGRPAFRDTTDFKSFAAPLAVIPEWDDAARLHAAAVFPASSVA